jgi:Fe-S cluster assembly scaffold protein SufB
MAYRHWLTMTPPEWAKLEIAPIDFQAVSYYAAPKAKYASLADVPQELLDTYEKLGVPLHERARLAGVACSHRQGAERRAAPVVRAHHGASHRARRPDVARKRQGDHREPR